MLSQHTLLHCTMCVYIRLCLITLPPFYIAFTRYAVTLYIAYTLDYASLHCCLLYTATQIYFVTLYTVCIQWIMPTYTATIFLLLPQQTLLNFTLCIYWIMPYYTAAVLYCHHNIHCYIVHSMYTFDFALLHRHLFYTAATTYIITLYTLCIH